MDRWIAAAVLMLIGWGVAVVVTDAPGWVHLFLTGGVTMLIWRIVTRSTPSGPSGNTTSGTSASNTTGSGASNNRSNSAR